MDTSAWVCITMGFVCCATVLIQAWMLGKFQRLFAASQMERAEWLEEYRKIAGLESWEPSEN